MSHPINKKLWEKAKKEADKHYKKHSAYKSGFIVKFYKDNGGKFKGNKKESDLKRWFDEKWTNQHGTVGYHHKNDIYRPTFRINSKTPKTWSEIPKKRIRSASREKYKTGRVKKFI